MTEEQKIFSRMNEILAPLALRYNDRNQLRQCFDDAICGVAHRDRAAIIRALETLDQWKSLLSPADEEEIAICLEVLYALDSNQIESINTEFDLNSSLDHVESVLLKDSNEFLYKWILCGLAAVLLVSIGIACADRRLVGTGLFMLPFVVFFLYLEFLGRKTNKRGRDYLAQLRSSDSKFNSDKM